MKKTLCYFCLVLTACLSGSEMQISPDLNASTQPPFSAVIGQEVKVYSAVTLQQPIQVSILDFHEKRYPVSATFTDSTLTFRVPPQIATGIATVEVISADHGPLTGKMRIRRLAAVANRGGGNLLLFDVEDPQATISFSLQDIGGYPEDVAISSDGRFANVVMAGNPAAVSIEIARPDPQFASHVLPTDKTPSSLAVLPGSILAISTNFGDDLDPGGTVDLFTLQSEGSFETVLAHIAVGSYPNSRPFDIATHSEASTFALISNRQDASITKITLDHCLNLPSPQCPQLFTFTSSSIQEPTGIALTPQGDQVLVADYAQNAVHVLNVDSNSMSLSASLALIGGDKGPVALRITPGGGKALVLNETSATLAQYDLTQGFPLPLPSLSLNGSKPGKMCLSHAGTKLWVTFSGSNEIREIALNLFSPIVSDPLGVPGLNNPRGIAIQP